MDGLYYTIAKKCKTSVLGDYVLSNRKVTNYIMKKCKQTRNWQYLNAQQFFRNNVLRSIATYYTSGVMGKRKYQAVEAGIFNEVQQYKERW